jgi:glycosyltransferase involved in cell wall biosynthesis
VKIFRVTTLSSQLNLLLKGQFAYLAENDFEVIVSSAKDKGYNHIEELVSREKCTWLRLPITRRFNPVYDLITFMALLFYFKKYKPDIVHTHSPKAGFIGQFAAYVCNVPTRIHTVAGLPLVESSGIKKCVLEQVEKFTYNMAHWILPNSINMAEFILNNELTKREKINVIGNGSSNGIDLDYFSITDDIIVTSNNLKSDLKIPDDVTLLLYVGRMARSKGLIELVRAFDILQLQNSKLHLLLVGNLDEKDLLPNEITKIILNSERITFVGHKKDVRPYMYMSDIFIFPSYREGLPQSLLQACAMGKCCIATNIDGCNEIISNQVNGLLVPVKDIGAIINAINCIIESPTKQKSYGRAAQEFVKRNYDQKILYSELLVFYRQNFHSN